MSIGACIADTIRQGGKVDVATLFAGAPQGPLSEVARGFHHNCGLPNDGSAMTARRAEDVEAMAVLGAVHHHGGFVDAVFRMRGDGSWLCQHERGMFDHAAPTEHGLASELAGYIDDLCTATSPDALVTCAGIGGHLDHLLARYAVLSTARQRGVSTWLWEDLPYALDPAEFHPARLGVAAPHKAHAASWEGKWEAIARYPSQVRMLWGATDWKGLLRDHAISRGDGQPVEILWEWTVTDD